jgi:two-component system invasion response regulator UvrY
VPVRTLTVDDHLPFLRLAHQLVDATPGFEPVGEASSGEEALACVEEATPQLMLVDVRMPGMGGAELAQRVHEAHPEIVVVLISADEQPELPPAVHRCGAAELVRKQDLAPALLQELREKHQGSTT